METIEKTVEIDVPVNIAYNQWTQFEEFPLFMEGVKEVRQLDEKRLHWKAEIAGKEKEWDAEIFEQIPDRRIAWRSMAGATNTGMVNFAPLADGKTEVSLKLNYEPETGLEKVGDAIGLVSARVSGDLKRFKKFIEERQTATGGWRGAIHGREISSTPPRR